MPGHSTQLVQKLWNYCNILRTHDRLTEAAKLLGLRVLDHAIVTKKSHFSFQESSLI